MAMPWFRPKRYGLGWTPSSWQGWVVTVAYVAAVVVLAAALAEAQPYIFWTLLALATVVFFVVVFLTRGR